MFAQFHEAQQRHFPTVPGARLPCVKFHSWIGGDRVGNPQVTADVTARALAAGRKAALQCHLDALRPAAQRLSITCRIAEIPPAAMTDLTKVTEGSGAADLLAQRNPGEVFRQALTAVSLRLEQTLLLGRHGYPDPIHLVDDLKAIESALISIGAGELATQLVRPLRWRAEIFGFRTTSLDVRQNATVINKVLAEVWQVLDLPHPQSSAALRRLLATDSLPVLNPEMLGPVAQDLMALLALMQAKVPGSDPEAFGPFIVSMTRSADDLLAVYLLARLAGGGRDGSLVVVPLFETITDLRAAPAILTDLMAPSAARSASRLRRDLVEVVLGYSDSNKDGGYFCST